MPDLVISCTLCYCCKNNNVNHLIRASNRILNIKTDEVNESCARILPTVFSTLYLRFYTMQDVMAAF